MEWGPLLCSAALILFLVAYIAAGAKLIPVPSVLALYSPCIVVTSMVSGYWSGYAAAGTTAPFGAA